MMRALLSTMLLVILALMACSDPAPTGVAYPTSAPPPGTTIPVANQAVQTQPADPAREPTRAATPTPKPKPTATASPVPMPTATAKPTSIPTSQTRADTDREALVALYNATDGQNWTVNP